MFGSKGSAPKPAVRSATGGTGTRPARLPSRPRMPHARTPRRQVAAVTALSIAVLVLLVGVVVGAASVIGRVTDDEPSNISEIVNSVATPSTTPSPEPAGCPVSAGDQNSGEGVIAAFEHAYYTLRSADAAIALLTPGAAPFAADMQSAINATPEGTTYCMTVTGVSAGTYAMELDESRPSGKGASLYQRITTAVIDGRHFITSITDAEGIR